MEKDRLRDTTIFFATVDVDKCPARKFIDDWIRNVWNTKLGYLVSFYRLIQKGLFVIFFKDHKMQKEVLNKQYWSVGKCTFRALEWTPKAVNEEIIALSCPRWVLILEVAPLLWKFIPQILESIGKAIRVDNSSSLIPHLDARVLISINPGFDFPKMVNINLEKELVVCPIEILGGVNAFFLCRKEGHICRNCPIINKTKGLDRPRNQSDNPSPVNEMILNIDKIKGISKKINNLLKGENSKPPEEGRVFNSGSSGVPRTPHSAISNVLKKINENP